MKVRVRYTNGRLKIVQKEVFEEIYGEMEQFEVYQLSLSQAGSDPIRSMIRGGYDPVERRGFSKSNLTK